MENFGKKQFGSIYLNKKYKNPYQIPKEVHIQAIRETQGEYYKSIFHKVADDYRIIFEIYNGNESWNYVNVFSQYFNVSMKF